jgi:EAL domain-containing protein (putative c-di-GMP-specific phosphodiesterase class I)
MIIYKTIDTEDFKSAFENKEFSLAYQPIMNLKTDGFETFEAFIRWNHPTLGTLPPSIFINALEKANFQEHMTEYVFDAAIEQILNNLKSGYGETGININLTVQEFYNPNTLVYLEKVIKKLPQPEFLGLEISPHILTDYLKQEIQDPEYHADSAPSETEKQFLESISAISNQYRELGVTLALDTTDNIIGSLIRADILGFHAIKVSAKSLQRAFFSDVNNLNQYVQASKDFQIPLVIVGVETESFLKLIYKYHIEYAQGLFFCPPLCLNNPKQFQTHLDTYFNAKNNMSNLEESVQTLKDLSYSLNESLSSNNADEKPSIGNNEQDLQSVKETNSVIYPSIAEEVFLESNSFDDYPNTRNINTLIQNTETQSTPIRKSFSFGNRQALGNHQVFGKK